MDKAIEIGMKEFQDLMLASLFIYVKNKEEKSAMLIHNVEQAVKKAVEYQKQLNQVGERKNK